MNIKDIPASEWHKFKRLCPNVRKYLNHLAEKLTDAQQSLSGYADAAPKCLNNECKYYNEKYDMNCDANEDLCENCLGTSDKLKRCRK
jgi:hypothetical protein